MAALPSPDSPTTNLLYDVFAKRFAVRRSRRLGGSSIGAPCDRAKWYAFRWASDLRPVDGRHARLRESGTEQEAGILDSIRAAGIELYTIQPGEEANPLKPQIHKTSHGGHAVVYLDGIGRGFPEAPAKWHIISVKVMKAAAWRALKKGGVEAAEPTYYGQSQFEMALFDIDRAILIARNRDTEEMYVERIRYKAGDANSLVARAQSIIATDKPPPKLNNDPEWWQCRMCEQSATCHDDVLPPINCRTCLHSTPSLSGDAKWTCALNDSTLSVKRQLVGCERHVYNPHLLDNWARVEDATETGVIYHNDLSGHRFEQGPDGWTSAEMLKMRDCRKQIGEPRLERMKTYFDADVLTAESVQ